MRRVCKECGEEFEAKRRNQLYCSKKCRIRMKRRRYRSNQREHLREKDRRRYWKNPAVSRERNRRNRLANPEKERERQKRFREKRKLAWELMTLNQILVKKFNG